MINIGMACQPNRFSNLHIIIPVLAQQCDRMFIHVNGGNRHPGFLMSYDNIEISTSNENYGAAKKFVGVPRTDGYYLSVDDDILYPPDYVDRMVKETERLDCIMCAHGSIFYPYEDISKNFRIKRVHHFAKKLSHTKRVMMPGTATVCFHTDNFRITPEEFDNPNICDPIVMIKAASEGMPIYCIQREANWIKQLKEYGSALGKDRPREQNVDKIIDNLEVIQQLYKDI